VAIEEDHFPGQTDRQEEVAMPAQTSRLAEILETDLGVDPNYRHASKCVAPAEPLETPGAVLKWYGVHADDRPIPDDVTQMARRLLTTIPLTARGLGFVILHRCGEDFYFLIVCTWRNSNELWQTVFYKDGEAMAEFALFPREGTHKPTLCVWEMTPAWHEREAWLRFLASSRDEEAALGWLRDRYAGPA
jgi:hypothetical protein